MGNPRPEILVAEANGISNDALSRDDAAWLDDVLAGSPAGATVDEIPCRLRDMPFGEILAAIDRARPDLSGPAELGLYRRWIEANTGRSPLLYAAWFNIGVVFAREGDRENAATSYRNALALRPELHGAAINLGLVLEAEGQTEAALATWQRATQPDAVRVALEIQQARLLEKLGRLAEAEQMLRRVLTVDPEQPDVLHHWIHIRQKMCQWPVVCGDIPGLSADDLTRRSGPLSILALTDDIDLQRESAARWIERKTEAAPVRLAPFQPYPRDRIRIGYLSSDFCNHAMSFLITELIERHDRERFEVFGYCSSKEDGSPLRRRVLNAFDHVRAIRPLSDEQAARTIRDDEIDVLIDLNGITEGSRLPVLRWRPAPVQATYLGFVGPVPLAELDYLLCDNVVIPPEHRASYAPAPLAIAGLYQANDSKRSIGSPLSRAEIGLPEDRFVLCCFCKHYKITQEMFGAWMAILRQADRAVLWLARDNAFSEANLLAAARAAGVAEERLIFSDRTGPDLYLSRLAQADLFLDTFPYNAGTVASDAIRMQLPIVTMCGKAFASRMATSLLSALGAARGITTTFPKYIETAVQLATKPSEHERYKALFTLDAWRRTIGDISAFTAEYEATWCRLIAAMRVT